MVDNIEDYLFHGTGVYCLAGIIASNTLFEGTHWGKPNEPYGPRMSECHKAAGSFVTYNAYYAEGGVIVLNKKLLAQDFKLIPYRDQGYDGSAFADEKEIVAETPAIKNLSKYLVGILFDPAFIKEAKSRELIEMSWSEGGWANDYPQSAWGIKKMRRDLDRLGEHPLLNVIGEDEDIPRHGNFELPETFAPRM